MLKSFIFKAHEWLAHHVSFIQYPNISGGQPLIQWKYKMSIWKRIDILLLSIAGIVIFGGLFIAICIVSWAFIFG
jgi:hypothetical protein